MLTSYRSLEFQGDGVPIEECAGDLIFSSKVKLLCGAEAKASLNRAFSYWN